MSDATDTDVCTPAGDTVESPRSPPRPVVIDHTAFPSIINLIVSHTTYDDWIKWRQTSRAFRDRMEALICYHIRFEGEGFDNGWGCFYRPDTNFKLNRNDLKIPCLRLDQPFRGRIFKLLGKHTRILDLGNDCLAVPLAHGTPSPDQLFTGLRLLRRGQGIIAPTSVHKHVAWEYMPTSFSSGKDKWDDIRSNGVIFLVGVRHLVFHFDYDKKSAIFSPRLFIHDWKTLDTVVWIFSDYGNDHFGFPKQPGNIFRRPKPMSDDEFKKLVADNTASDVRVGRDDPANDLRDILQFMGILDDAKIPISKTTEIIFVGLEEFVDVTAHVPKNKKNDKTTLIAFLRKIIGILLHEIEYVLPRSRANEIMSQIKIFTHEEYCDRIGLDEYWLETRGGSQGRPLPTMSTRKIQGAR